MSVLDSMRLHGPFIIVGHGLGSLYAQYLAQQRAVDIRGMVLINPMTVNDENIKKRFQPSSSIILLINPRDLRFPRFLG
jgi:predicted alpha/beta hydrolase family esterase